MSTLDVFKILFFALWAVSFLVWLVCISVKNFRENGYYSIALIPLLFWNVCIIICNFIGR